MRAARRRGFAAARSARTGGPSLRLRVSGWTVAVFSITLAAFTAIGIVAERRNLEELAEADAQAFLAHLAEMPQFRATPRPRPLLCSRCAPSPDAAGTAE